MLNILEGFDLKKMGFLSADALHVMIETKKLVFEDRAKFTPTRPSRRCR